ncbi:MAG: D-alanine--D-alanine ligase [Candidatus Omnitrophota bacterium]
MTGRGKIGVLAGGPSSEREISLKSGAAVYAALNRVGVDIILIDVLDHLSVQEVMQKAKVETVFLVLHGGFGEDGTIQKALEDIKIPYTGSGPEASRLALDKLASREVFIKAGMTVPECEVLKKGESLALGKLDVPLVVKPRSEGSSIGLSTVFDKGKLDEAVERAFKFGETVLVERFIKGRELTVGILDEKPLPVIEISAEGGCYDYYSKYESSKTRYMVPAPITASCFKMAQDIGISAHRSLGCRSFSRVDMILGDDGRIYVLEVNTIPGLTERSLLPKAASSAGIGFVQLCERILEGAQL